MHEPTIDHPAANGAETPAAETLTHESAKRTTAPTAAELPGYEILEELGRGGMGVVYKARQIGLKRLVAVKMILAGEHASPQTVARFRAEAESVARLQHPGIVQIHEIGECRGLPYFTLEYVEGGPLNKFLAGNPLPPRDAARLVHFMATAIDVAHQAGIVHRDLKPGNVLVVGARDRVMAPSVEKSDSRSPSAQAFAERLQVKITDFGLAKQLDDQEGRTASGDVLGTPSYMAPEQAEGRIDAIAATTDVYALGAILYELLTGRPPFKAPSFWATIDLVRHQEPVPPRQLQPGTPRDLETICLTCLRKEAGRRYASAAALADDLTRFLDGLPIRARQVSRWEIAWRWCRRKPAAAGLLAAAVLFVTVIAPLFVLNQIRLNQSAFETENANIKAQASQDAANMQQYHSLVNRVRQRNAERPLGWTRDGLDDLANASRLKTPARDEHELRNLAAACLGGVDLRVLRSYAVGAPSSLVAFSPDGKILATAPHVAPLPTSIRLFDVDSGQPIRELDFQPDPLFHVRTGRPNGPSYLAFSPDGRYLVVGARNGQLHRWDLKSKDPPVAWAAHPGRQVVGVAFGTSDQNQKSLYSAGGDSVKIWNVEQPGKELASFAPAAHEGAIIGLAVDPIDNSWVLPVVEHDEWIRVLDPKTLKPLQHPRAHEGTGYGEGLVLSRCGRMAAFHNTSNVRIAGVTSDKIARRVSEDGFNDAHFGDVDGLAFSPDSAVLASASGADGDRSLKIWEVATGRLLASTNLGGAANKTHLAFHSNGRALAVAGDRQVTLYTIEGLKDMTYIASQPDVVAGVATYRDGGRMAVLTERRGHTRQVPGELVLWNGETNLPLDVRSVEMPNSDAVAAAPRGELAATRFDRKHFEIVDESHHSTPIAIDHIERLAFHPGGQSLWAIRSPRSLIAWNARDGKELFHWQAIPDPLAGRGSLTCLAVGEKTVVVGGRGGSVMVFSQNPPKHLGQWHGVAGRVESIAIDPSESLVAIGGAEGHVLIRSVENGELIAELKGHTKAISSLAFAVRSEGLVIATASRDKSVRIWRQRGKDFENILTLTSERSPRHLEFNRDGTKLFVLNEGEYAVRVWHLDVLRASLKQIGDGLDW